MKMREQFVADSATLTDTSVVMRMKTAAERFLAACVKALLLTGPPNAGAASAVAMTKCDSGPGLGPTVWGSATSVLFCGCQLANVGEGLEPSTWEGSPSGGVKRGNQISGHQFGGGGRRAVGWGLGGPTSQHGLHLECPGGAGAVAAGAGQGGEGVQPMETHTDVLKAKCKKTSWRCDGLDLCAGPAVGGAKPESRKLGNGPTSTTTIDK